MSSYSKQVKERLSEIDEMGAYESISELLGIILFACSVGFNEIKLSSESDSTARCFNKLLNKVLGVELEILQEGVHYVVLLENKKVIRELLILLKLIDGEGDRLIKMRFSSFGLKTDGCMSAFLRGAFLGGGTIVDPKKNYSIEFVTRYYGLSREFCSLLDEMGLSCSVTVRNSKYIIYSKNSERIEDILIAMGDEYSARQLLEIKERREIQNGLNRAANSETANIDKAINASIRQIQAIEIIERSKGLDSLSPELKETALLRLKYKELSLSELGRLFNSPLSKSGVSHRLRKIESIADDIQNRE